MMTGRKRRILLIEESGRNSVKNLLETDFELIELSPVQTQSRGISAKKPDCVLLNTALPKPDADSLVEMVTDQELPLIVIGEAEESDRMEDYAASPMTEVLLRPLTSENLVSHLYTLLEKVTQWQIQKIVPKFESRKRPVVLLAEEERITGSPIPIYLKEWYDVIVVSSLRDAFRIMEYQVPGVLLFDIELPKKEGMELYRELGNREYLKNLSYVCIIEEESRALRLRALSMGAKNCISRPVHKEQLLEVLQPVFGQSEKAEAPIEKKHILVVDDFSIALKTMKVQLEDDYLVTLAASGKQALTFLEHHRPDLIFMDVEMPEMNGLETVKQIKENPVWSNIPIIFLTGNREKDTIYSCMSLGAADYMVKPVSVPKIQEKIKQVLERE